MSERNSLHVYRMTHIQNVPHILKWGITHRKSAHADAGFISIGDESLISNRSTKTVTVDNGDFLGDEDYPEITLGDYIPFYFGIRMPMLYVIQQGGNFVKRPTAAKDIVYLVCPLKKIVESGIDYYFSDGHATDKLTSFYDSSKIGDLDKIIDWTAVKAQYWGGNDNLNVKRKKQAELLVADDLPAKFVTGIGCYNEAAKQRIIEMGFMEDKIKVIHGAYY